MLRYLTNDQAFAPEAISILSGALDGAWAIACADSVRFKVDGNADAIRDILAKQIVAMALQGERDPQRLITGALDRLRL